MNEWSLVVAAIDKKINVKINKSEFNIILNL